MTYSWKIVSLNKSNDIKEIVRDWQIDLEDRNTIDPLSVYNKKGELEKEVIYENGKQLEIVDYLTN